MSVREYYRGKSILVSGGTGFMGKVLLEKLLYSVPDIGNIYVLMRPKKGKTIAQRLEMIRMLPLFDRLRNEKPNQLKKLISLQGDVLFDNLGLSDREIENLSKEVSVMFHFAATLKLEAPLKENVNMNTCGTQRALDVAKRLQNLSIFVHLSTAFCYPDYKELGEIIHAPPADPKDVMRLIELLDDHQLSLITSSLIRPHPNCYTFSKRLAESIVANEHINTSLRTVIVRPSIVCPSVKEPMAGWVDSLNGPIGVMIAAGKGVIRTMLCDGSLTAQVIPVDTAINAVIAIGMIEGSKAEKPEVTPIYNANIGHQKPTTWREVLECGKSYGRAYPLAWPLWYPNGDLTTNLVVHEIKRVLFHLLPAYFIDLILFLVGQKRFMVRIQNRISQGLEVLQYFTMRPWSFPSAKFDAIQGALQDEEKEMFNVDLSKNDRDEYLSKCVEGGRVFCLKEDPTKIPMNRAYHNFLFVLDTIVKVFFWLIVISFIAAWITPVKTLLSYGGPLVAYLPFVGATVFGNNS